VTITQPERGTPIVEQFRGFVGVPGVMLAPSPMDLTLYYIPFSPWSLKARFALAHHGLRASEREYKPLFDEPALRVRLRKARGRISVPVLLTPDGPLLDSWEIALYADRVGNGTPLIPGAERARISDFNAASERLLSAGRARSMLRAVEDPEAIREALPGPIRDSRLAIPVGRLGARLFNKKYGIHERDLELHASAMRLELDHLEKSLRGRSYLLGDFSYADVTMAFGLQVVDPLPGTPLSSAMRRVAKDPELCDRYSDLLRWRDGIQARHGLLER
jgi:glutathione S-transferase